LSHKQPRSRGEHRIGGGWELYWSAVPVCSHRAYPSSESTLVSILRKPVGMLRSVLSELTGGRFYPDRLVMYVARLGRDGDLRMARPCDLCLHEMVKVGVTEFIYTTDHGTWKRERA
jgi:hypothetical protein